MRYIAALLILVSIPVNSLADELSPFTTDGCSVFPDGTLLHQSLWLDCCIRHDLAYWAGGSSDDRRQADVALKNCVDQTGEPDIARLMLSGVRVGGSPYLPTTYRWGYGWPYLRGYQPLSDAERQQVIKSLGTFMQMAASISQQLENKKYNNEGSE